MKRFTKGLCLFLVLGLILAVAGGCAGTTTTTAAPAATTAAGTTAATAAATTTAAKPKEVITLNMFYDSPELYNGWKWGGDPVTQDITAKCGIALNIKYAASSNHEELYTMLASGSGFPDLLRSTYVPALYDEGYAVSLNKLADQYCKPFYDVLPYQYREVHAMDDGDIYYINVDYSDSKKLASIPGGSKIVTVFVKNNKKWEEMGKPSLETLEDVRAVAKQAKANGSKYPVFLTSYAWGVTTDINALQIANASFAGPQFIYKQANGVVTFNIKSEPYKKGAAYVNSLYQDGLIQADNFTFKASNDDSVRQIAQASDPMIVIGHEWQLRMYRQGMDREGTYIPIEPPLGPGIKREDIVINDFNASNIGNTGGVFVMSTTKQPKACIEFLTYMLKDDVQLMTTHGREGIDFKVDFTKDTKYGRRIVTDALQADLKSMKNPEFMNKWGYYNSFLRDMVRSRWAIAYYNRPYNEAFPEVSDDILTSLGAKYAKEFKELKLATKFTDADEQLLYNNVTKEWTAGEAEMILAPNNGAFEAAYAKTIANMNKVGLADLEKLLTERYNYWMAKLGKK